MAANLEYQLLSKIIDTQDFHTVERFKIDESYFFSPECREVFTFIKDNFRARETMGSVPSLDTVKRWFPSFPYAPSADTLETLCDQLKIVRLRSQIMVLAEELSMMANTDPKEAIATLREAATQLSNEHEGTDGLLLSQSYKALLEEYELISQNKGLTGLPWPWEVLNEETQGIHKGEFIVLYGRPKSMKTWIGLLIAVNAYVQANARVLIYSPEMSIIQMVRRAAAILSGVDYEKLKKGQLNPYDADRFFSRLQDLASEEAHMGEEGHVPAIYVTRDKGGKGGGVMSIRALIKQFKPDLVLVDSFYLLKDDRQRAKTIDWKAIAHVSQDLKATAVEENVPIIGINQANRGAAKSRAQDADLSELSYSDAIGQDCDLAMRVSKMMDKETMEPEIHVAFPGSRESRLESFVIHGIPATNFSFKRAFMEGETIGQGVHDVEFSNGTSKKKMQVPSVPIKRLRAT